MFENELEILKTAIVNEQEGYQFYLLAADKSEDIEIKAVFSALAAEEKAHEAWLRSTYKELIEKGAPGNMAMVALTESPQIFTPDKLKGAGGLTVSALHIGVMMEKSSMDFYRKAASRTEIEALRKLLLHLGDWEKDHLDRLEKAYDFAREEWWEQQGFSES